MTGAEPQQVRARSGAQWLELCALLLVAWNVAMVFNSFRVDWTWSIEDDVRQSMFYFASAADPELFRGDALLAHARAFQPPGFELLVSSLCRVVDIVIAAKLVALLAVALTLALIPWAAGSYFRKRSLSFWLAMVFCSAGTFLWYLALTGMSRGYAAPLALFALIAFQSKGHHLYLIAIVLAALFSPTVLVFLAALLPGKLFESSASSISASSISASSISASSISARVRALLPAVAMYAATIVISAGLLWLWQSGTRAEIGPPADYSVWKNDPAFGPQGRWVHERILGLRSELRDLATHALPLPKLRMLALAGVLAASGYAVLRRSAPPALRATFWFFAAGLVTSQAASLVAFKLYHPNRYWIPVVPALLFGFVALLGWIADWVRGRWTTSFAAAPARWLLIAAGLALALVMVREGGYRGPSARRAATVYIAPSQQALLVFLRDRLPKSALIAGNPFVMDNVPLFAKRSVWTNYEMILPLYPRHYLRMVERTNALIPAYFSWSEDALRVFACASGVTHIVADRSDFREGGVPWASEHNDRGKQQIFIAPFSEPIGARIAARPSGTAWLLDRIESGVVFANDDYRVIDLAPFRDCAPSPS